jgi:multisubunit Na+/H+ antiporter MnhG subunit
MKSGTGSHELTRLATAYCTSIAFGLTFLIASFTGVDGGTALWRSITVGAIALVLGYLLASPVVDAVLTAMARDEAKRAADDKTEDDA